MPLPERDQTASVVVRGWTGRPYRVRDLRPYRGAVRGVQPETMGTRILAAAAAAVLMLAACGGDDTTEPAAPQTTTGQPGTE